MTRYFPWAMLALIVTLVTGSHLWADDAAKDPLTDGLIFYAPLDGSLDAKIAGGSKTPTKDKNVTFSEGKFGQAAVIKGDAQLYYPATDNLDLKQGTVAMWVKRDTAWAKASVIFFKAVAGPGWNCNALYLMTTDHAQLRTWVWDKDKKQTLIMSPNGISYEANRWYHLALTYTDGAVRMYVDGKEISYATKVDPMLEMPSEKVKTMQVGSDYTPAPVVDGMIDELRIYNRPLSPEQIAALAAYTPAAK